MLRLTLYHGKKNAGICPPFWGLTRYIRMSTVVFCPILLLLITGFSLGLAMPKVANGQTALGEIEARPAPVSRRQCIGGANAGNLCNEDGDCPGSSCQKSNIYNINVAVRFNATAGELTDIRNAFTAGSELLFDVTDGQAQFGQVSIFNNSSGNRGHYWVTTAGGCAADTGSWGSYSGGNITISLPNLQTADVDAGCVAHEFTHLTFDAKDEYETGCGGVYGAADCPDVAQGANSAAEGACLMECCGRIGSEYCWGQAAGDNLAAGNHDAGNVTEQSRCRSNRSCWDQVVWSWPETILMPAAAPDPGSAGLVHTPLVFVEPPVNARLVMVLDRSGSMISETPSRLERLKTAALDVVDMAEDGVELGLVSFSSTAVDEEAVTALGADRSDYLTAINNLTASGATNIGDGLQHAYDMIIAADGVTAETAIILMTDGRNNQPPGTYEADLTAKLDMLMDAGVPVYVTCTGDDMGLDSQCAEIAAGTGGTYVDSVDAANLPERFVSFYEQFKSRSPATQVSDTFWASTHKYSYQVHVEPNARVATFVTLWKNSNVRASMTVKDPDGHSYDTKSIPQGRFVRINNPKAGTWIVRLDPSGGQIPGDNTFVVRSYIDNQKINVAAAAQRKVVQPGETMHICARPLDETPLTGVIISGQVTSPSGRQSHVNLLDDGGTNSNSGDDTAGDGIYCTNYSETKERGSYTFQLQVVAKGAKQAKDLQQGIIFVEREPNDFERWVELSATVDDTIAEELLPHCPWLWLAFLVALILAIVLLARLSCEIKSALPPFLVMLVVTVGLLWFLFTRCDLNMVWFWISVALAVIIALLIMRLSNFVPCIGSRGQR